MKKIIINSSIGFIFTVVLTVSAYMFNTVQQNHIDSAIQRTEIKSLNENVNRSFEAMAEFTNNVNKRVDKIQDTLSAFQATNLKNHRKNMRRNDDIIYYLRLTDKKFQLYFSNLAEK